MQPRLHPGAHGLGRHRVGPELVSVSPASNDTDSWHGRAQPWEVSNLQVVVGARTIVATTARLKGRLAQLSREAEKAALVADQFVTAGRKPDIYRVYLADKNEWNLWYGSRPSKWVAGYAEPIGEYRIDVVVSHAKVGASLLDDVLRHELTHVSTLHGEHHWKGNWCLIEGIAELAEHPQSLTASTWSAQPRATYAAAGTRCNRCQSRSGPRVRRRRRSRPPRQYRCLA